MFPPHRNQSIYLIEHVSQLSLTNQCHLLRIIARFVSQCFKRRQKFLDKTRKNRLCRSKIIPHNLTVIKPPQSARIVSTMAPQKRPEHGKEFNTNGIAERAVQTFKKAMEKASRTSNDYEKNLARWLLLYRNTPNSVTNQTPAMMMFNRPTRTLLSLLDPLTNNEDNLKTSLSGEGGKDKVRTFEIGDQVRIRNIRTGQWYRGSVIKKEGCKVYWIKSQFGVVER